VVWGKDVLVPRPSKYSEDFRRDAVELVRTTRRTLRDVGWELGVNHEILRGWVSATKRADEQQRTGRSSGDGELSGAEREELRRLRRKFAELELELLRKSGRLFCEGEGR
jgi:transposase